MRNVCPICHKDLSACNTIMAAQGRLYCSRACVLLSSGNVAVDELEEHVDGISEEILPEDAGISTLAMDMNCDMCSLSTFTCAMCRLSTPNGGSSAPCQAYKSYDEMVEVMGFDPLEITLTGTV